MKRNYKNYTILLLVAFLAVGQIWAQKTAQKLKERFNTKEDVLINIDTQYADVVFENWNKDEVEIEAVLETEGLSQEEIDQLLNGWKIAVQGNSSRVSVNSMGGGPGMVFALGEMPMEGIDKMIESSLSMVEPMMNNMLGPLLESLSGTQLPPEYYRGMSNIKFDYDAYKRDGDKYLEEYERKVEKSFGDDFDKVMKEWEKENADKMKKWELNFEDKFAGMPRSPFGGHMNFDSNEYEKDKKGYVAKLNKKYGTNASVKDVDEWLEELEAWGEDFGKGMEAWGEQFGEQFGKRMEIWGENMGKAFEKDMEAWGENFGQAMEQWGEQFGQQMEKWAEEHEGDFEKKIERDENGNVRSSYSYRYDSSKAGKSGLKGKRKIIVRMPKNAKLDLDVRHGNIKLGDASNARINLSHGGFVAQSIDGEKTFITVAYSPVDVNNWNYGTLRTSYVKNCVISKAQRINVDARASNVIINELNDSAIISGSFGELSIPKISKNFTNINISLENSDLVLRLPESAFHFTYTGTRSNLNYPRKLEAKVMDGFDSKMVNGFHKSRNTDSAISISAKFSDVVVN